MPSNKKKRGTARSNKKNKKRNNNTSSSSSITAPKRQQQLLQQQQQRQRWTEGEIRSAHGEDLKLGYFPMSKYFVIAYNLRCNDKHDEAEEAYKRGREIDSCVWCIYYYADFQKEVRRNIHRAFPWYLEGAIRGHSSSMVQLFKNLYQNMHTLQQSNSGLQNFWCKIYFEFDKSTTQVTKSKRIMARNEFRSSCVYCRMLDMPEKHLCEGCRLYSYCSEECQRLDWKTRNHRGECRQLKILKHHYRKHAKEIRDKIVCGVDPKTIASLQRVRTELGLNQPKDNYEDLLRLLDSYDDTKDDVSDNNNTNPIDHFTGRAIDGTVHIGSTPSTI